jgi:outer membrane lipoprotein carrier protein
VTRAVLWVSLATLAFANDSDLSRVLKGVEARYNRAKTLKVLFEETYTVPGRPRRSERGELTLRKPGRMRWDYASPLGKLFLSDGHDVYLYSPDTRQVEKMKLKESEDMRAPLAFLLGKLDFSKEFRDFQMSADPAGTVLTAVPKSDRLPYEKIEMLVQPDFTIRRLVVTGQDKSILSFQFDREQVDPAVNDAVFRFRMPPGASMAPPEASQ